jgi:hypothetical protein
MPLSLEIRMGESIELEMKTGEVAIGSKTPSISEVQGWLLANAGGVIFYLMLEFWLLAPRSEADELNGIDVISFWLATNFPLLVSFIIADGVWLRRIIKGGQAGRQWRALSLWLLVCFIWMAVILCNGITLKLLGIAVDMIDGRAWK